MAVEEAAALLDMAVEEAAALPGKAAGKVAALPGMAVKNAAQDLINVLAQKILSSRVSIQGSNLKIVNSVKMTAIQNVFTVMYYHVLTNIFLIVQMIQFSPKEKWKSFSFQERGGNPKDRQQSITKTMEAV
ncbi:uncharacterized protein V6R79_010422 [Siganus canaliculatus]